LYKGFYNKIKLFKHATDTAAPCSHRYTQ